VKDPGRSLQEGILAEIDVRTPIGFTPIALMWDHGTFFHDPKRSLLKQKEDAKPVSQGVLDAMNAAVAELGIVDTVITKTRLRRKSDSPSSSSSSSTSVACSTGQLSPVSLMKTPTRSDRRKGDAGRATAAKMKRRTRRLEVAEKRKTPKSQ
jgi:hypothetical protein